MTFDQRVVAGRRSCPAPVHIETKRGGQGLVAEMFLHGADRRGVIVEDEFAGKMPKEMRRGVDAHPVDQRGFDAVAESAEGLGPPCSRAGKHEIGGGVGQQRPVLLEVGEGPTTAFPPTRSSIRDAFSTSA